MIFKSNENSRKKEKDNEAKIVKKMSYFFF